MNSDSATLTPEAQLRQNPLYQSVKKKIKDSSFSQFLQGYISLPNPEEDVRRGEWFLKGQALGMTPPASPDPVSMGIGATDDLIRGGMGLIGSIKALKKTPIVDDAYKGAKGLTTKVLEMLKGKSKVSPQYIQDLTNMPQLKQAERDLIRSKIPKVEGLDALKAEARKYKSAEEFVGSKISETKLIDKASGEPITFYRGNRNRVAGIKEHDTDAMYGRGIYFTTEKRTAEGYAKVGGGTVSEVYLNMRNPLTPNSKLWYKFIQEGSPQDKTNFLIRHGFDGVSDITKGKKVMSQAMVLKPEQIISKSQLTDIYNQSKGVQGGVGDINVPKFAKEVEGELLPLTRSEAPSTFGGNAKYESITLPDELRGPVANYSEHIYESPIKTSAGSTHFGGSDVESPQNYFAHTRVEDLADIPTNRRIDLGELAAGKQKYVDPSDMTKPAQGNTRRVIELQSDLFQKGGLEKEIPSKSILGLPQDKTGIRDAIANPAYEPKIKEVAKLEPYRNTWHERVIREEVKKAAQDGKTKLQFPTGETAMKIEGLGGGRVDWSVGDIPVQGTSGFKSGMELTNNATGQNWIITDVLGDGKFKAVPKSSLKEFGAGGVEIKRTIKEAVESGLDETFDISGKVDINNPIYKFYEKEVGRYITNKYKAKVITDPQGVKWYEVDVPREAGRMPIEAFGVAALLGQKQLQQQSPEDQVRSTALMGK